MGEDLAEATVEAVWADLREQLRRGAVDQALALVETHLPSPVGREFAGYAETLLNQGEVVGSGAIEKGVDLVLNRRFKGRRGMRWWRANAKAIVTLRTQILNHQAEAA